MHARARTCDLIDVSRAHAAFRSALAQAPQGFSAKVAYRARAAGAYALFASPDARIALTDPAFSRAVLDFCVHRAGRIAIVLTADGVLHDVSLADGRVLGSRR